MKYKRLRSCLCTCTLREREREFMWVHVVQINDDCDQVIISKLSEHNLS